MIIAVTSLGLQTDEPTLNAAPLPEGQRQGSVGQPRADNESLDLPFAPLRRQIHEISAA